MHPSRCTANSSQSDVYFWLCSEHEDEDSQLQPGDDSLVWRQRHAGGSGCGSNGSSSGGGSLPSLPGTSAATQLLHLQEEEPEVASGRAMHTKEFRQGKQGRKRAAAQLGTPGTSKEGGGKRQQRVASTRGTAAVQAALAAARDATTGTKKKQQK
jgi:hypothetical protein